MLSWPWVRNTLLQQRKPTTSQAVNKSVASRSREGFPSPSIWHLWDCIWSSMSSFGLCSTRYTGVSSAEGHHDGQGDNYQVGGCKDDRDWRRTTNNSTRGAKQQTQVGTAEILFFSPSIFLIRVVKYWNSCTERLWNLHSWRCSKRSWTIFLSNLIWLDLLWARG